MGSTVAMHGSTMIGNTRIVFHCADVRGVDTIFATVEYPLNDPPDTIEICGTTWGVNGTEPKGGIDHDG